MGYGTSEVLSRGQAQPACPCCFSHVHDLHSLAEDHRPVRPDHHQLVLPALDHLFEPVKESGMGNLLGSKIGPALLIHIDRNDLLCLGAAALA